MRKIELNITEIDNIVIWRNTNIQSVTKIDLLRMKMRSNPKFILIFF